MKLSESDNKSFFHELLNAFGIAIIIFIILYVFLWSGRLPWDSFYIYLGMTMLYSMPIQLLISYMFKYLNKRLSWETNPQKMIIVGSLLALIISLLWIFIVQIIEVFIFKHVTLEQLFSQIRFSYFRMPLYITAFILILVYAFYFYKEMQKSKIREANLYAENTKAKYSALKDQIDPHFLFNNLNVLYSLIDESTINAKKFVKNLSSIYRYILEHKKNDLISLEKEIDFATKYLGLLKFRFEDSLVFDINITNKNREIVPLASQLLLENAIKHNIITSNQPLNIKVFTTEEYFIVQNNFNPLNTDTEGTKHGLKSINERCKYLMNKEIILENENGKYTVKVPLK